jgi:hypothetical protein
MRSILSPGHFACRRCARRHRAKALGYPYEGRLRGLNDFDIQSPLADWNAAVGLIG